MDGFDDPMPHGVELSESESRTSDECCEVGAESEFSYPALTMGEEVRVLPTPKYKQRRAQRVEPESKAGGSQDEPLFDRTMSEEEELWDRNLREMEEREERPKRRRRTRQLALEDGKVEEEQPEEDGGEEREESSGSRDVPSKGTKRMLALMDRQTVRPTARGAPGGGGVNKIRPTRTPQRDVMLRRVRELQNLAEKAKAARAGLLQKELAKVKANPKLKAKEPNKAKAKKPEAKAKEPVVPKGKDPAAAPKSNKNYPWRVFSPPAKKESAKEPPKKANQSSSYPRRKRHPPR